MKKTLAFIIIIVLVITVGFISYAPNRRDRWHYLPNGQNRPDLIIYQSSEITISLRENMIIYTYTGTNTQKGIRLDEEVALEKEILNKPHSELPLVDVEFDVGLHLKGETMEYLIEIYPEFNLLAEYPQINHDGKYILVDKSDNILYLYDDARLEKQYKVASGQSRLYTPEGTFSIANKIMGPGEAKSQLGPAWLGLSVPNEYDKRGPDGDERAPKGLKYGIHGTDEPDSIGTYVTGGCIRLSNEDILDLYERVETGTHVEIRY